MPLHTFYIPEAKISIFPLDASSGPMLDNPVYLGAIARGITISESLEVIEDRASGEPFPQRHHGAELHSFTIERLWEVDVTPSTPPNDFSGATLEPNGTLVNGSDYKLRPNQTYVVAMVWQDESDSNRWTYRCYFGVTDKSHQLSGEDDSGLRSSLQFDAQYYLTEPPQSNS